MKHLVDRLAPAIALALLASAGACTLAEVDADVDEACLRYDGLEVPAAPAGGSAVVQSFEIDDLDAFHRLLSYDAALQFVRAEVSASGAALPHVDRATVGVGSAFAVVYACDGDCMTTQTSLVLPASSADSALPYLTGDSLAVDLAATGALPTVPWTVDVNVCVSGHAHDALSL